MMNQADLRSLNYIAAALKQISVTLRDFKFNDTAKLLDKARSDLETKLKEGAKKEDLAS
jgi:hypothetical protein